MNSFQRIVLLSISSVMINVLKGLDDKKGCWWDYDKDDDKEHDVIDYVKVVVMFLVVAFVFFPFVFLHGLAKDKDEG